MSKMDAELFMSDRYFDYPHNLGIKKAASFEAA